MTILDITQFAAYILGSESVRPIVGVIYITFFFGGYIDIKKPYNWQINWILIYYIAKVVYLKERVPVGQRTGGSQTDKSLCYNN